MSKFVWEEIHGFESLWEYSWFYQYIEAQVETGYARETELDPDYGYGEIYGGRWFEDIDSGKIWRLIEPDFPFKGLWEPVRR